jgi:hypothetical protein
VDLKPVFLEELRQLRLACAGPWAIAGDFNLILAACDKNTPVVDRRSMGMFRRCVNDLELREVPLLGRRFTWSNERVSPTLVKLDRWFASVEWNELYPEASLSAVSSSLSDHCPILLTTVVQSFVGRRFRFERFWLKLPGFAEVVKDLWMEVDADAPLPADPLRRLEFKLRRASRGLQSWSQRKVGSIRDLILVANEVVSRLDVAQEGRPLSMGECELRRGLKLKVLGLASMERTIVRQRARVAGIAEGDASSKFFRIMASARRSHNYISALRSGDQLVTDLSAKVEAATDFFVGLLGTAQPRDTALSFPALGLHPQDLSALDAPFREAEVWAAICAMPTNKSPGPDGFTWEFYRHCWPIIKVDDMDALREVWFGRDQGFDGLNEALITLLPKKEGAVNLQDFWPISLVHSFARLFTKVLARRLAPRMPDLVDTNQTAFIRGRCIQDNFLLARVRPSCCTPRGSPPSCSRWMWLRRSTAFLGLSSWRFLGIGGSVLGGCGGLPCSSVRPVPLSW